MIRVFTSTETPHRNSAGEHFQEMIDNWLSTQPSSIKITNIHSNSNQYGWMIIIQYEN